MKPGHTESRPVWWFLRKVTLPASAADSLAKKPRDKEQRHRAEAFQATYVEPYRETSIQMNPILTKYHVNHYDISLYGQTTFWLQLTQWWGSKGHCFKYKLSLR